jgi:hypothetical protein
MILLFVIFLPLGISHIPIFTIVILLFGLYILSVDFNALAIVERKPANNISTHPFKGMISGILGIIPVLIIVLVINSLNFGSKTGNIIRVDIIKVILAPVFGFVSANVLFVLMIPIVTTLTYLYGYYGKKLPGTFKGKSMRKKDKH